MRAFWTGTEWIEPSLGKDEIAAKPIAHTEAQPLTKNPNDSGSRRWDGRRRVLGSVAALVVIAGVVSAVLVAQSSGDSANPSSGSLSASALGNVRGDDLPTGCEDAPRSKSGAVLFFDCAGVSGLIASPKLLGVVRRECADRYWAKAKISPIDHVGSGLPVELRVGPSRTTLEQVTLAPNGNTGDGRGGFYGVTVGHTLGAVEGQQYIVLNCFDSLTSPPTVRTLSRSQYDALAYDSITGSVSLAQPKSQNPVATAPPVTGSVPAALPQSHLDANGCKPDFHDRLDADVIAKGLVQGWQRRSRVFAESCAYGNKELLGALFARTPVDMTFGGCKEAPPDPNGNWGDAPLWHCSFKQAGGRLSLTVVGGCGASIGCGADAIRFES